MLEDDLETEVVDYFKSNILAVRNAIQKDFKKFASLGTGAERIAFILSYSEVYSLSPEVENVGAKDGENAVKLKDTGNKFFAQAEFHKALETYSNAVLLATKKELGVIFANRAAVLYRLEKYEHALVDIEEALRVGYPKELLYKVEERRARCLLALKRHDEAMHAFKKALQALDYAKISLDKKKKVEADIRLMHAVMEKGKEFTKNTKFSPQAKKGKIENKPVPIIENRNSLYPACNNSVEIRDDGGEIGRHAIATRDIPPGEILIVEPPHCASLLPEYRLTHCHLCFTKIVVPLPAACNACSNVAYCSLYCRNSDADVHIRECNLLPALWLSKTSITCFLALKTVIQKPFTERIKMKALLNSPQFKFVPSKEKPYKGEDYQAFHSLITHEDERTAEDLFHRTYMAVWLLRLLKTGSYFPEDVRTPDSIDEKPSEGELFVGHLLLHNLQLLQFNSHEISELRKPRDDKTLARAKSMFIGGGIYPTTAMLNHSCNPGVIRYFIGTTMIVISVRTITAGAEISDNYGPIFTINPENERKRKLRVQYWFNCQCQACTEHWPMLEDLDPTILRFKCDTGPACGNILPVRTDSNEFMIQCTKCGNSKNILKGLKTLQDTDWLFKTASRQLEEGNHEKALHSYTKILKLLDETLALPIRDYHICQQGVRLCASSLGNISIT